MMCLTTIDNAPNAPVAQLDRAAGFEPVGRGFKSLRARQPSLATNGSRASVGKPAPCPPKRNARRWTRLPTRSSRAVPSPSGRANIFRFVQEIATVVRVEPHRKRAAWVRRRYPEHVIPRLLTPKTSTAPLRSRAIQYVGLFLLTTGACSPTQPSVVAIRTITYVRVRPIIATVGVTLRYEYSDARCAGSDAPTWCRSSSGIFQGLHPLVQSGDGSFSDPDATLLNNVPVDTLVAVWISDTAVDSSRYVAENVFVNGTRVVDVRNGGLGQTGYFRLRSDGSVY